MTVSLADETREKLVRAARSAIGDELRSVTYFTPDEYEHVYLRGDLERGDETVAFVETERQGFDAQRTYEWSELGNYDYNVRVFDRGYVVRVIEGESGVYVTTDRLPRTALFDDVVEAVREVLADLPSDGAEA